MKVDSDMTITGIRQASSSTGIAGIRLDMKKDGEEKSEKVGSSEILENIVDAPSNYVSDMSFNKVGACFDYNGIL